MGAEQENQEGHERLEDGSIVVTITPAGEESSPGDGEENE
jgi:hypothetical protein